MEDGFYDKYDEHGNKIWLDEDGYEIENDESGNVLRYDKVGDLVNDDEISEDDFEGMAILKEKDQKKKKKFKVTREFNF